MQRWHAVPVAVGGVVAVGFLDEDRVIVGSHSGTGVFDVQTGKRTERTYDEGYDWYQGDPDFSVDDPEEYRAQGFSPFGGAFV